MRKPSFTGMVLVASFILTTIFFFVTGSYRNLPWKVESDGKYYYHYLISLVYDHDIDFSNDYVRPLVEPMTWPLDPYQFHEQLTVTGKPKNVWTIGPALLWLPFFVLAGAIAELLRLIGAGSLSWHDGWSLYFQYATMFSAVVYAHVGLWLAIGILRRWFTEKTAVVAVLLIFWGTNLVYYTYQEPSMSHVYDFSAIVLFFFLALRANDRKRRRDYIFWGLSGGLATLVRTQNVATVGLVTAYYLVYQLAIRDRHIGRLFKDYATYALFLFVAILPLLYTNNYLYGNPLTVPQGETWMQWTDPDLLRVLFSGRNGLFPHSPLLLAGLAGLFLTPLIYRDQKNLVITLFLPLLLAFLAQWYINAAARDWWAGHAFGMRRLISVYLFFALGLAILGELIRKWRRNKPLRSWQGMNALVGIAAGVFILVNAYLMMIHILGYWDYGSSHNVFYYYTRFPFDFARYLKDKTPPVGDFTEPPNLARVTVPLWLRVQAADAGGTGIKKVKFTTNASGVWKAIGEVTAPPYEWLWDAKNAPLHQPFYVGAEIYDQANNRIDRVRQIEIAAYGQEGVDTEPPTGTFIAPAAGLQATTQVRLRLQAEDNVGGTGVARVRFTTNAGGEWSFIAEDAEPPFEIVWDASSAPRNQPFLVGAEIYDFAGNRANKVQSIILAP